MGRDFRDSSYYRRTWLSKRTIKDGEACVKWSLGAARCLWLQLVRRGVGAAAAARASAGFEVASATPQRRRVLVWLRGRFY